ncbi:nucleotidyltransferase family protein [Paenibacillus thailandensis]|uniref:Nucleotidyltransferase family protein n=2 Tax=Paenibacillus thailandensis TaxID=393250 RepID=A0ABW5R3W7_9BACL
MILLSNEQKELNLLLLLISSRDLQEERIANLIKNINWDLFVELAIHHKVYSILYTRLKRLNQMAVPVFVLDILEKEYKRNSYMMLELCAETIRVSNVLIENDVKTISLKGPILGYELYGDITLRTSKDIDLLVSENDISKSKVILEQLGYICLDRVDDFLRSSRKWHEHHLSFYHPIKKIEIELHWRLNTGSIKELVFNQLWESRTASKLNKNVYLLGEADLFMYLAIHGAGHAWFRLKWLLDMDRIINKNEKVDNVLRNMDLYNNSSIGAQSLILAESLLGTPITRSVKDTHFTKKSRKLAKMSMLFIRNVVQFDNLPTLLRIYFRIYLLFINPTHQKIKYVYSQLLPNKRDFMTLKLPKQLFFLYFLLKPLLWVLRQFKLR